MRVVFGSISWRSSTPFGPSVSGIKLKPVTFPPGRARLATKSRFDGVGHAHDDDWDGLGGFLGRQCSGRVDGDDYFDLLLQKLLYEQWESLISSCRISQLYADLAPFDITEFAKLVAERLQQTGLEVLGEYTDPMGFHLLSTQRVGHGNN